MLANFPIACPASNIALIGAGMAALTSFQAKLHMRLIVSFATICVVKIAVISSSETPSERMMAISSSDTLRLASSVVVLIS